MKASIKHRYQKEKNSTLKWVKVVCVCMCVRGLGARGMCDTCLLWSSQLQQP